MAVAWKALALRIIGVAFSDDDWVIHLRHENQLCVDVPGGKAYNGAKLWIWSCNGASQQNWRWCGDGTIRTELGGYTKCLDVPGGSLDGGPQLQLWDCNGGDNQKWGWTDYHPGVIAPGEDGVIYYSSKGAWSYCIDIPGGDPKAKSGAPLIMWPCSRTQEPGEPFQLVGRAHVVSIAMNLTSSGKALLV